MEENIDKFMNFYNWIGKNYDLITSKNGRKFY